MATANPMAWMMNRKVAADRVPMRSARKPHASGEASCIEAMMLMTVAATTAE